MKPFFSHTHATRTTNADTIPAVRGIEGYTGHGTVSRVTVESYNRVVTFGQICAAATVTPDECVFWGDTTSDEYLGHETVQATNDAFFGRYSDVYLTSPQFRAMRAHLDGDAHGYRDDIIKLDGEGFERQVYNDLRANGASKMVATEAVAALKQSRLEAVKKAYKDYLTDYCIDIEFGPYTASVNGYSSYDYECEEGVIELAFDVAAQLEADGFIVLGKPHMASMPVERGDAYKAVNSQNWDGPDTAREEKYKAVARHERHVARKAERQARKAARKVSA